MLLRSGPGGVNRGYEQNKKVRNNSESGMFETTFGVDGEVETYTNEKPVSVLIKKTFLCEMQKGINYTSLELVELTNLSEVKHETMH